MFVFEIEFFLAIVSTIGAAVWTVITWAEQQALEREMEQDKIDALYINPFLIAAEELQSLLYRLLAQGEIEFLRTGVAHKGDNEGEITYHEALEIVYVIIKYFGWSLYFHRYGSYTQDKTAIQLTRYISELFADRSQFGDDIFRFTYTKQHSLGEMFVKRIIGTHSEYAEFTEIPLYRFDQEVMESGEQMNNLYQDLSKTLDAIRQAKSSKELEGRGRLCVIQNTLVDLTNYIEKKEGFTVSKKLRRKVKLIGDKVIVKENSLLKEENNFIEWLIPHELHHFLPHDSSSVSVVETLDIETINIEKNRIQIVHKTEGRIRLKVPRLFGNEIYFKHLEIFIQSLTGVESIQVNQVLSTITIYYNNKISETEFETALLETISNAMQQKSV